MRDEIPWTRRDADDRNDVAPASDVDLPRTQRRDVHAAGEEA